MEYEYDEIHLYHDSPISPKWDEKTIQEASDLDGLDPLTLGRLDLSFTMLSPLVIQIFQIGAL